MPCTSGNDLIEKYGIVRRIDGVFRSNPLFYVLKYCRLQFHIFEFSSRRFCCTPHHAQKEKPESACIFQLQNAHTEVHISAQRHDLLVRKWRIMRKRGPNQPVLSELAYSLRVDGLKYVFSSPDD